jgi:RNA polymerase sigma-70 factor (ECF subfamily)
VNTAITHYRRNTKHSHHLDVEEVQSTPADLEAARESEFTREELNRAIAVLPPGYGQVFQMYVIDGFRHQEIADMLGVDVNTSKSQLSRARGYLQRVLAGMSRIARKPEDHGVERLG